MKKGKVHLAMSISSAINVCCCHSCSPKDTRLCKELEKHLSVLVRSQQIVLRHPEDVLPGDVHKLAIAYQIATADVVLLALSPDFFHSDYCMEQTELALRLHYERKACVVPLLLHPVDWEHSPLYDLVPLPRNRKPIKRWPDQHQAFLDVVHDIHLIVERLRRFPRRRDYLPDENCKIWPVPFIPGMRSISREELQPIWKFLPTAVGLCISGKYPLCKRSSFCGEEICCHIPLGLPGAAPATVSIDTADCAPKNMGRPWVQNLLPGGVLICGYATAENSLCEAAGNITLTY